MPSFNRLWRFVFKAASRAESQDAAEMVAERLGIVLPPVKPYEVADEWMTDVVEIIEADSAADLLGKTLALSGRLGNGWLVEKLSGFEDDGNAFATFNPAERNASAVPELIWGHFEIWPE